MHAQKPSTNPENKRTILSVQFILFKHALTCDSDRILLLFLSPSLSLALLAGKKSQVYTTNNKKLSIKCHHRRHDVCLFVFAANTK